MRDLFECLTRLVVVQIEQRLGTLLAQLIKSSRRLVASVAYRLSQRASRDTEQKQYRKECLVFHFAPWWRHNSRTRRARSAAICSGSFSREYCTVSPIAMEISRGRAKWRCACFKRQRPSIRTGTTGA